eukprot:TRINITY_DN38915_c0_g1_i1.p1 TRINITY_DN38915_c0_g1~~TRINITY_DN38915_c0_g1_i1.p1  ORF type:complete len:158 (+),score=38.49 TRINITY_DN38915_c0_g1_i1:179-652(+)
MSEKGLVEQIQPGELKKGGYAMIKSMPCRITEIEHKAPATANGNKRVRLIGLHIFTGKKYEDTLNLTAGFHGIDVPVTTKAAFTVLDVDATSGFLSLLDASGETKEDAALSRAEDGIAFDEVGDEVLRRFSAGESLKVTVLTIMDKDIVIEVSADTD